MPRSPLEADWLQDTLEDAARRLRHDGEDLAWCADQLEKIVSGLRAPPEFQGRSSRDEPTGATKRRRSGGLPLIAAAAVGGVGVLILRRLLTRQDRV